MIRGTQTCLCALTPGVPDFLQECWAQTPCTQIECVTKPNVNNFVQYFFLNNKNTKINKKSVNLVELELESQDMAQSFSIIYVAGNQLCEEIIKFWPTLE